MKEVQFTWPYEGTEISLWGSFNQWQSGFEMESQTITLELSPGTYQYKFVVDGKWFYDVVKPTVSNGCWDRNNFVRVREDESVVTVVHVSDCRSMQRQYEMPEGDVLVVSGDFTVDGHPEDFAWFDQWLDEQPYMYRVGTLGECDLRYMLREEEEDHLAVAQDRLKNMKLLSSEGVEIMGLTFYGVEWHWFHTWDHHHLNERTVGMEGWRGIPEGVNVLVTHSPPKGILDRSLILPNTGSRELLHRIEEVKPNYHLFGHIHECNGIRHKTWLDGSITTFSNASGSDIKGDNIINQPRVFHLNLTDISHTTIDQTTFPTYNQ